MKKYIIFDHFEPDDLYFIKNIPEDSDLFDDPDLIIEDVTEYSGQCLVENNDESVTAYEHPESLKEMDRKIYQTARKYFEENPDEDEFEEELTPLGILIDRDDIYSSSEDGFKLYSEIVEESHVVGDSESQYQLVSLDDSEFEEYMDSDFAEDSMWEDAEESVEGKEACATEANESTAGIKKILDLAKITFEENYPTYNVIENGNNGLTVGDGNNKVTVGVKVKLVPLFRVLDDMGEIIYESTSAEDAAFQLATLARDLIKYQSSATESVKTKKKSKAATESFDPLEKEILDAMKKGRTNIL